MKSFKPLLVLLVLLLNSVCFAQSTINDYKYVLVPERYDFLKSDDQYQLNSLTAFLFKKNGFTVVSKQDRFPDDLAQNNCLALQANVVNIKGLLMTKLQVVLKNCKDEVVFTSEIGKSKLKAYKKAYHEALRKAFELSTFDYNYNGTSSTVVTPEPTLKTLPPIISVEPPSIPVAEVSELDAQAFVKLVVQPTNSGYDFIDSNSKKIKYSTHATLFEAVYIIEGHAGIIYKRGQNWVREYVENGKTIIEALNVER